MSCPMTIVTGLLGSGKTRWIQTLKQKSVRPLIVQFENGETAFHPSDAVLTLSIKRIRSEVDCATEIYERILETRPDHLFLEWNGFQPLSDLFMLLSQTTYHPDNQSILDCTRLVSVDCLLSPNNIKRTLTAFGDTPMDFLMNSDRIVVPDRHHPDLKRFQHNLRKINPQLHFVDEKSREFTVSPPLSSWFVWIFMVFFGLLSLWRPPFFDPLINGSLGILLQAIPFLLLGTLLSSAVQVFLPSDTIQHLFPKNKVLGLFFGLFGGFLLPVCDCATIPVIKSLYRKGVPVSATMTFMAAAPIINPIVLLSTYVAFNGDLRMVMLRTVLGLFIALYIGLIFIVFPPKKVLKQEAYLSLQSVPFNGTIGEWKRQKRWVQWLGHAQMEFLDVGKYLCVAAVLSTGFQIFGLTSVGVFQNMNLMMSTVFLMSISFLLSLCSSSDAMIARSFTPFFPLGSIMAFLVFGPIIDLKNILMLSECFHWKLLLQLSLSAILITLLIVGLCFSSTMELMI